MHTVSRTVIKPDDMSTPRTIQYCTTRHVQTVSETQNSGRTSYNGCICLLANAQTQVFAVVTSTSTSFRHTAISINKQLISNALYNVNHNTNITNSINMHLHSLAVYTIKHQAMTNSAKA